MVCVHWHTFGVLNLSTCTNTLKVCYHNTLFLTVYKSQYSFPWYPCIHMHKKSWLLTFRRQMDSLLMVCLSSCIDCFTTIIYYTTISHAIYIHAHIVMITDISTSNGLTVNRISLYIIIGAFAGTVATYVVHFVLKNE